MKIAEYNQMMAYLMRPKFNGGGSVGAFVKPKKKPEKEVKKRKLENFEKAKPALENPEEVKKMLNLADGGRIPFGIGGLTTEERKILKKALEDNILTKAEYNKIKDKPPADSTNFGGGRKGMEKRNWLGVSQRIGTGENAKGNPLFRKIKRILNPGAEGVGSKLFLNEKAKNIITKAANAGKDNKQIIKLLERANVDFGSESVKDPKKLNRMKSNKVASTINSLIKRGLVDEKYTRTGAPLKNTGDLTDFELKQKVKSTVEDLIKNPEKYKDKSLTTIQKETLGRLDLDEKTARVDVIKAEIKRQLGDKKGTKFIQDNFETTTEFSKKRLKTLLKDNKIKNLLKSKDVNFKELEKRIAKVLKVNINSNDPSNAAYRLAEVIKYEPDFVDVKIPKTYLNSANKILDAGKISGLEDPFNALRRIRMEKEVAKELGEGSTFFSKTRKGSVSNVFKELSKEIGGPFKKLVGTSTDELGTIKGPYLYGSEGNSIFMQTLTKTGNKTADNINLEKGKSMDKKLIQIRKLIAESKTFPTKEVEKYNTEVKKIAREMNANLGPNAKPIRPFIIVPGGDPTKTIANFAQIAKENPDIAKKIIKDSRTSGFSARIPADIPTAFQLQDKGFVRKNIVDNLKKFYNEFDEKKLFEKIRNQTPKKIQDIFGKGRKFLRFVEAEPDNRRFASANNIMSDATFVDPVEENTFARRNPITTGTGLTTAGTAAVLKATGTPIKTALGKAFRTLGTPIVAPAFAATNVAAKMGEGQSFADAVVDPITGLELSFPGLFKENISKITKSPTLQKILGLGRVGRMLTPVGLGLAALGQGQEFYNQYQDLQKMKRDDPEAYQQFRSTRVAPALSSQDYNEIYSGVQGAAGGGIAKLAGKSSGPAPESGPTPQGLDFLIKRGR